MCRLKHVLLALLVPTVLYGAAVRAEKNALWSGLNRLRQLADELGHPARGDARVDVGVLDPHDGLLIIGPRNRLPVGSLSAFLDAGGRLAILDDFGAASGLLSAYQIRRDPPPTRKAVRLRDNADLLVAIPASDHPLTEGVDALLTNRPTSLDHAVLKPVFTFSGADTALVLAGAVGNGRLVAVGDSSLLINQLLTLPAQERFARNLVEYLSAGGGELWLAGPKQELFGTYGRPHRPGIERANALLSRLSHPDLPRWTLIALTAAAVFAVLLWALGSLPKVTPYLTPRALPAPRVWAGFAGRVDSAHSEGHNLLWTALDYRAELAAGLARNLRLSEVPNTENLLQAAEAQEATRAQCEELAQLLRHLDILAGAAERPDELPRVTPADLSRMVITGERLMASLERGAA